MKSPIKNAPTPRRVAAMRRMPLGIYGANGQLYKMPAPPKK